MPDILEIIFMEQADLQSKLDKRVHLSEQFIKYPEKTRQCEEAAFERQEFYKTLHDHSEALMMESVELINWIAWKGWSKKLGNSWDREEGNEQFSDEHVHEMRKEAMDCLIFTVNLFLILGMKPSDLMELYNEKLETNTKRQQEGY